MNEELSRSNNVTIYESFIITMSKINNPCYENVMVSISGGSDSDVILDICTKLGLGKEHKCHYVFFDTGLEYQATKDHLNYLEQKYGIEIEIEKAVKPIPLACRQYGQPFLSKQVSEYISRLQQHNFKWEDKPLEQLMKEYPNCKVALMWWTNSRGENSSFNIERNKYLKEFMTAYPPTFQISNKCCKYAKKLVAKRYKKVRKIDLEMVGIRKAEGGARAKAYKNCFSSNDDGADEYRPIFWYKQEDKEAYERAYKVHHSKCYTEYGLKRTGCCGCPYGRELEKELEIMKTYEPKLYKAVNNVFKDSYEYTRAYRQFTQEREEEKSNRILTETGEIHTYKQMKLF